MVIRKISLQSILSSQVAGSIESSGSDFQVNGKSINGGDIFRAEHGCKEHYGGPEGLQRGQSKSALDHVGWCREKGYL